VLDTGGNGFFIATSIPRRASLSCEANGEGGKMTKPQNHDVAICSGKEIVPCVCMCVVLYR
jgi:hypothetical protein